MAPDDATDDASEDAPSATTDDAASDTTADDTSSATTDDASGVDALPLSRAASERFVRRAIELAREAAERGDDPYGSLLVDPEAAGASEGDESAVLMEARNAIVTDDDIARHPELTLARRAARELSPEVRERAIMYTSTQSCPMCAGGIAFAGLAAVVHSVSAETSAELAGSDEYLPSGEVYDRLGAQTVAVGPLLESEGLAVHREFRE